MPIYRFRILDKSDRVIAGQHWHCEDDDVARRHAEILAAQTKHSCIEIWRDAQQVPRISPADALPLADEGGLPKSHRPASVDSSGETMRRRRVAEIAKLCSCPNCGSPDLVVVKWPKIVACLACKRRYSPIVETEYTITGADERCEARHG